MFLIYISLGNVLTFKFFVAFCIEKVWATYYDLREGIRHDWFKTISAEPNQGKNILASNIWV